MSDWDVIFTETILGHPDDESGDEVRCSVYTVRGYTSGAVSIVKERDTMGEIHPMQVQTPVDVTVTNFRSFISELVTADCHEWNGYLGECDVHQIENCKCGAHHDNLGINCECSVCVKYVACHGNISMYSSRDPITVCSAGCNDHLTDAQIQCANSTRETCDTCKDGGCVGIHASCHYNCASCKDVGCDHEWCHRND